MRKIKYLFLLIAMILVLPLTVFAEGEEEATTTSTNDKAVKVYFFRGEGCSHCAEATAWFETLKEEYGDKFTIVDYETWYNEDNHNIMKKVAEARGEEEQATGVPYIIIGDQSWIGFDQEVYAPEIKSKIDELYAQDVKDRYDIQSIIDGKSTEKDEKKSNDVLSLILIIIVVGGACFGIYKARSTTK